MGEPWPDLVEGRRMKFNDSPIDVPLFDRNRRQFPAEQLQPYWGKCVAWNAEGTQIVASGETWAEVRLQLKALGIHPLQVVDEFIPHPDVSYFA
jgi:hypothetical protein